MTKQLDDDIIAVECRHATWIKATYNNPDAHVCKLVVHREGKDPEPVIKTIVNYKRAFYVTKHKLRDHKQKREYEKIDNLIKHMSTDSELFTNVGKALNKPYAKGGMREHSKSPYLYGSDVSAAYCIKEAYMRKGTIETECTYCTMDIETNVLKPRIKKWNNDTRGYDWVEDKQIIINSVAFKNNMHVHILKEFVVAIDDPVNKMHLIVKKHLDKYLKLGLKPMFIIHDDEATLIRESFAQVHKWKPDFLGLWYGSMFDIPYIESRCDDLNIDKAKLWSDPDIHPNLRRYRFIPGKDKRTTAKGSVFVIPPEQRWAVVEAPASFVFIDAMCCYKALRMFAAKESLALDAILKKETETEKLKLDNTGVIGLELHRKLQTSMPVEYSVYGGWDTYSMLELDLKTKDISLSFPMRMGAVEYKYAQTSSRKTGCKYHSFLLHEMNCVLSACYVEEADDRVLSGEGWINNYTSLTVPA